MGGSASKPPPRGSSASLNGGSSADRYGGSSADKGGVVGPRDTRLGSGNRRRDQERQEEREERTRRKQEAQLEERGQDANQ